MDMASHDLNRHLNRMSCFFYIKCNHGVYMYTEERYECLHLDLL
jgi:hypothetical protein